MKTVLLIALVSALPLISFGQAVVDVNSPTVSEEWAAGYNSVNNPAAAGSFNQSGRDFRFGRDAANVDAWRNGGAGTSSEMFNSNSGPQVVTTPPTSGAAGGSNSEPQVVTTPPTSGGSGSGIPMPEVGNTAGGMSTPKASTGMGAGSGVDLYYLGTGGNFNEMLKLNAINADTTQILSETEKIQTNIANMKEVMSARQKLIVAVAKMNLLVTQGKVIQRDPFDQSSTGNSGDDVVNSVLNAAAMNPSGYGGMQNFGGGGDGGSPLVSGLTSIGAGAISSAAANGVSSLISADSSGTAGTVINAVSAVLGGMGTSVTDLIYSGVSNSFSGMNSQNIDNIMGHLGRVIALDREAPQAVYPLTAFAASRLGGAISQISSAKAGEPVKVADGFYVRKESPYDAAYVAMVQEGSGAAAMQFFAAVSGEQTTDYTPIMGKAPEGKGFTTPVNMNDVLTSGAYGAVQRYNAAVGATGNPYSNFAQTVAPVLTNVANSAEPNEFIEITPADISAAESAKPVNLKGFKPLTGGGYDRAERFVGNRPFASPSLDQIFTQFQPANSVVDGLVAVLVPNERDTSDLMGRISASDSRIKQNSSMLVMNRLMLSYSQSVLLAASNLRNELQRIAGGVSMLEKDSGGFVMRLAPPKMLPVANTFPGGFSNGVNAAQQIVGGDYAGAAGTLGGSAVNQAVSGVAGQALGGVAGQALGGMLGGGAGGSGTMNEGNAIESIMMMIQNCDNMCLVLQRQIADYAIEIERLTKDRNGELRARADIWTAARDLNERTAAERIHTAVMRSTR